MSEVTINDKEVSGKLDSLIEKQLPDALYKALEKACLKIEADAKHNVPANTGNLRNSITYDIEQDKNNLNGYIGSNVEYAPYVHQGTGIYATDGNGRKQVPWYYEDAKGEWHKTSGIKPTPFLQDAIDANKEAILKLFEGVL